MSRAALARDRLFRGKDGTAAPTATPDAASSARSKDPSLKIGIPKPPPMMTNTQAPAPPKTAKTDASPKQPAPEADPSDGRSYRERLIDRLGNRYIGVEKFRLQQDEDRERHWKRWGPYVSERQWVRRLDLRHLGRRTDHTFFSRLSGDGP
jgi:hypothetical protein